MCGIVGFITTDDDTRKYSKEKFMTEGLYIDALRGWDSTGIMSLSEDFRWSYLKQAVPAADFLNKKSWQKQTFENWCMVGHNRAATIGSVTTDNAHPFQQGDIILVHNGTLRSTYDLPHKNKDIEVDSELIAYNLSKVEPDEAPDLISKLSGAYALVWFDERDESVNIVRNSERPFHMGITSSGDALWFMSDGHMLNMLMRRFQDQTARPRGIYELATRQILKFKKGSLVPEVTSVPNFTRTTAHRSWPAPVDTQTSQTRPRSRHGVNGSSDNVRVLINNEFQDVPDEHKYMLQEWYDLGKTESCYFKPGGFMLWGIDPVSKQKEGMMFGKLWHPKWETWFNARIPYVGERQALDYRNNSGWTVIPIGCDFTSPDGDGDEITFVCRMQWFTWHGTIPKPTENEESEDDAALIEESDVEEWLADNAKEDDDYEDLVRGPHGHYITIEAFDRLTEHGCTMCTGPVYVEDAEELVWVGEHENQPLCMGCLDYHTSPSWECTGDSV